MIRLAPAAVAAALIIVPEIAQVAYQQGLLLLGSGRVVVSAQSGPVYSVLGSDVTTAVTTYADVTGLSLSLAANTRYRIECVLRYDANATTTGVGYGWTGPASPTLTAGQMVSGLTTATVGGTTLNGNNTGGVTTASVATTANVATRTGLWSNGANAGTWQLRHKSEVAVASAIITKAGSWCSASVY